MNSIELESGEYTMVAREIRQRDGHVGVEIVWRRGNSNVHQPLIIALHEAPEKLEAIAQWARSRREGRDREAPA